MFKSEQECYIIMNKARTKIAKGVPRRRCLVPIEDHLSGKDKKRVLTYTSLKLAENGFNNCWFYGARDSGPMEAVKVIIKIEEI